MKPKCSQFLASTCIPYAGNDLNFLTLLPEPLDCSASINEVFYKIDEALEKLLVGNDFTTLVSTCFPFNPQTVTASDLHRIELTELCLHKAQITTISDRLNNLNIGSEVLTIDLPDCFDTLAAPCAAGVNQYQLTALLKIFAEKLCDLETRISNLEP